MRLLSVFLLVFISATSAKAQQHPMFQLLKGGKLITGGEQYTTSPVIYKRGVLPSIVVVIGGKKYTFVIDSGMPTCVISDEIANGALLLMKVPTGGQDQLADSLSVVQKTLKIGAFTFDSVACVVKNMSHVNSFGCVSIDGIVGSNVLNKCNWEIDPEVSQVKMTIFKDAFLPKPGIAVHLDFTDDFRPIAKMRYAGVEFYGLIDYGYDGFVEINRTLVESTKEFKKLKKITGEGIIGMGFNSYVQGQFATSITDSIELQGLGMKKYETIFSDDKPRIGASVLSNYTVYYRPFDRIIHFAPLALSRKTKSRFPVSFGLNDKGQLIVAFVWHDSDKATAPLRLNQHVVEVNGQKMDSLTHHQLCLLKASWEEKDSIEFRVKDKKKEFAIKAGKLQL